MRLTLSEASRVPFYSPHVSQWATDERGHWWWKHRGLGRWFSTWWVPVGPFAASSMFSAAADFFAVRRAEVSQEPPS